MLVVKLNTFAVFAIPPASRFELDECCGGRSNLFIALVISYLDNTSLAAACRTPHYEKELQKRAVILLLKEQNRETIKVGGEQAIVNNDFPYRECLYPPKNSVLNADRGHL